MSWPVLIIIGVGAASITVSAVTVVVTIIFDQRRKRRDRRRRHPAGLSDREVMDALAPFGADISVWPSRAPRNGSTHDDETTAT
jgi:hypothetical protein